MFFHVKMYQIGIKINVQRWHKSCLIPSWENSAYLITLKVVQKICFPFFFATSPYFL